MASYPFAEWLASEMDPPTTYTQAAIDAYRVRMNAFLEELPLRASSTPTAHLDAVLADLAGKGVLERFVSGIIARSVGFR